MTALPHRHTRILDFITACVNERGYPPSIREIGDHVGLSSPSSVAHHVDVLVARGYLAREPGRPRAIRVIPPTEEPS